MAQSGNAQEHNGSTALQKQPTSTGGRGRLAGFDSHAATTLSSNPDTVSYPIRDGTQDLQRNWLLSINTSIMGEFCQLLASDFGATDQAIAVGAFGAFQLS